MEFTREELDAQRSVVEKLRAMINTEVSMVQEAMRGVEAAKGRIGGLQVELLVEEKLLDRMDKSAKGGGDVGTD